VGNAEQGGVKAVDEAPVTAVMAGLSTVSRSSILASRLFEAAIEVE